MYFNKLDEEANYFTVTEEEEEDICTCATCIVSIVQYCISSICSVLIWLNLSQAQLDV